MNRVIKFKAYYPELGLSAPVKLTTVAMRFTFDDCISYYDLNGLPHGTEFIQFTGLQDRNGKDIYEGDILQCHDIIVPITFDDGSFQIITSFQQGRSPAMNERTKRFEVIGNIYENPELITDDNLNRG